MNILETELKDVLIIEPPRFGDDRGFFSETWNRKALAERGVDLEFVQDNHSLSGEQGTVRGLHFQAPPFGQDKLVRCTRGSILDVAVDARKGSPTYGRSVAVELSAENGRQLLVPIGFLHGFATLAPDTEVQYKVTNYYSKEHDGAVLWNDPSLNIDWGLDPSAAKLSAKDAAAQTFDAFDSPFVYSPEN